MIDPSKEDLLEFLDGHRPIGKQNPDHVCFDAIRRLIEKGPEVTKEQVAIWADRIMSEVEITGNVPVWLIRDILNYAGVRVKEAADER